MNMSLHGSEAVRKENMAKADAMLNEYGSPNYFVTVT